MWQMGGVGPMAGQAHHFLHYAPQMDPPQVLPYAQDRYRREVGRLYGVLDRQLAQAGGFVAGDFSIADMAIYPWATGWERQEQTLDDKPHMARWLEACAGRPGVQRGMAVAADRRSTGKMNDKERETLFGRR
jgi:GST-like protein